MTKSLNKKFIRDILRHFNKGGKKMIEKILAFSMLAITIVSMAGAILAVWVVDENKQY